MRAACEALRGGDHYPVIIVNAVCISSAATIRLPSRHRQNACAAWSNALWRGDEEAGEGLWDAVGMDIIARNEAGQTLEVTVFSAMGRDVVVDVREEATGEGD